MAYDYSKLDVKSRAIAQRVTADIRARIGSTVQGIIGIGQQLIDAKEALPHGEFVPWLQAEFEWSESGALRMMRVAHTFKSANLTDLKRIAPSALYLLAAPSTPDEIREDFIEKAERGKPVSHAEVKQAVAESRPEPRKVIRVASVKTATREEPKPQTKPDSPFPDSTLIDDTLSALARFKGCITELLGDVGANRTGDACGVHLAEYRQQWPNALDAMRSAIKDARPYAICPHCEASGRRCSGCGAAGWVGKHVYDKAPTELKAKVKGSIAK